MSDEEVEANAASDPDDPNRRTFRLCQAGIAKRFGLNLKTPQDWEQGRLEPDQVARLYLKVVAHAPDAVKAALVKG